LGPAEMTEAVYHRLETAMTHFKVEFNFDSNYVSLQKSGAFLP
jgi:hypothetical protein